MLIAGWKQKRRGLLTATTTASRSSTRERRSTWEAGARPETGARRAEESRNAVGQPRQDGAAGLTLTDIDAGSGVGQRGGAAAAIGEWEAVDGQAEAPRTTTRKR